LQVNQTNVNSVMRIFQRRNKILRGPATLTPGFTRVQFPVIRITITGLMALKCRALQQE
jgi:hypothetical protein